MIARFFVLAAAVSIGFATADAAECAGSNAIPGTLAASAAKPCVAPARKQQPELAKPKDPPGTFRSGNTTVKIGGAIVSETVVRGR
jgi:hypothetical protein